MKALTPGEARALDARTIAAGTPGLVLMERAAAAVDREIARVLARRPERGRSVVVLAGIGNNGGDGFETARLLLGSPFAGRVETLVVGDPARLSGDAAVTHRRLVEAGGAVRVVTSAAGLEAIRSASLVVDALFGTGLTRPLEPGSLAETAASLVSGGGAFAVAVDIPSGLDGGTGEIPGAHVRADLTVTFGTPRIAHVVGPAAGACGRIVVADIGFLPGAEASGPETVVARDLAPFFPRRRFDVHKGTFGRLAVVGGSTGMAGAPALAARAAHRAGAGLVTVAAPEEIRALVHALSPESMTTGLDDDLARFDAIAIGPGLGTSPEARRLFARLVGAPLPCVFDADALNIAAGDLGLFAGRGAPTILTPHPGEAARLLRTTASAVNGARVASALALAKGSGSVVVLKGFRTVVAAPDGRFAFVLAGNPGMATGGMGDVLTGISGALLARGLDAFDAARAAAWLHGAAGDLAREVKGEESLVASDLFETLPDAFGLVAEAARP